MRSTDYSDSAYRLVIEPHIAVAIWAIITALACVLVMIIAEMIKAHHAAATRDHPRPKKLGRKR
jgi:NADH:ubiquinone oxidoreductase subunit 3 (subunit A)